MTENKLLELKHITKRFPGVIANGDINFSIGHRQIVSIIGENGAGKSTLCKMLTGMYQPDEGQILMNGEQVHFKTVSDSMNAGISMVYQERNLVDMLTGAQNIVLNMEPSKGGFIDEKETLRVAEEIKAQLNVGVPLDVPVGELGAGEKQLVEIMRAIYNKPKLLILDEPTASLGEGEIEPFLDFVMSLKDTMGISVIFISHKINEVYQISDEIVVLTDGRLMLQKPKDEVSQEECITAMLRTGSLKPVTVNSKPFEERQVRLEVDGLRYGHKDHDVRFDVRSGEVVGFYGLVGAGRTETFECLYGLRRMESTFRFEGEVINRKVTPFKMIQKGMILTPEIRRNAVFKTFSLVENICSLFYKAHLASKHIGVVNQAKCREFADMVLKKNYVKYSSPNQKISDLSGGNMQKIIIGRSIEIEGCRLLCLDEPTTGMDVGAKNEIYLHMRELAENQDMSIVFISSELDELLIACDRIYVFAGGNVIDEFRRENAMDKSTILETAIRGRKV